MRCEPAAAHLGAQVAGTTHHAHVAQLARRVARRCGVVQPRKPQVSNLGEPSHALSPARRGTQRVRVLTDQQTALVVEKDVAWLLRRRGVSRGLQTLALVGAHQVAVHHV